MDDKLEKLFWPAVAVTAAVKFMLAAAIPVTSDEAYFTLWGRFLDYGYYDHPPMVGWILHLISFIGNSPVLIRLPAVLSTILIAIGLYYLLKPFDKQKAALVSVFLLVSPLNILNVLITTDTPFIFFSFLSAFLLYYALKKENYLLFAASGAALGAGFLSKYFAVFLGLAYAVYFVFSKKARWKTTGFILLFAAVLPFAAVNVYWNYTHCWTNIMFNVFNRNKKEEFSVIKILLYAACQAYLVTPAVIYYLVKKRKEMGARFAALKERVKGTGFEALMYAFAAPMALFALLSVKKVIGLHWVLGFYSFMYIALFFLMTAEELQKTLKFTVLFSAAHLFLIGAVLSVPARYFQSSKDYPTIVLGTKPYEVRRYLMKYESNFVLATPSYADSALLTYHFGKYFCVFGGGSHHGRQDDIITDFRNYDGKDVLILRSSEPSVNEYSTFFKNMSMEKVKIEGAEFYLVSGFKFDYQNYRNVVLKDIKDKYYNIPSWLPVSPDGYFFQKYFN